MKKILTALTIAVAVSGCNEAQVASSNLSTAADNFQIERRIVFYNGVTGDYILQLQGLCSIENDGKRVAVTCKTGNDEFKKHFLGLSDNVTYFAEQLQYANVNTAHYKVIFKPSVIIPDVDIK
jgi:hypothetical protein